MKTTFVLLLCFAAFAISFCEEDTYDTRYDNINIDEILSNDRILQNHLRCLLAKGPCTKEGRQLKQELPDAIETRCAKCSEAQKKIIRKACKHIIERKPDEWKLLVNKYDPTGEHQEAFQKFLNEE